MEHKESLATRIIQIEWHMFRETPGIGGPAPCQQDREAFEVARLSQILSWPEAVQASYIADLEKAEQQGRNLVTEKYARMMKTTAPAEYDRIEHLLPPLEPGIAALIDEIAAIVLEWGTELTAKYPQLMKRGRPLRSADGTPSATSIETYLRGELATYSRQTLELYLADLLRQKSENRNGAATILDSTVQRHGYRSLADAEQKLEALARKSGRSDL
jgi:hypothetical protein